MKVDTRAAVAYIVARLVRRTDFHKLLDLDNDKELKYIGPCRTGQIRVCGIDQEIEIISGSLGSSFHLFQVDDDNQIDLEIEGSTFQGFDEDSEAHFRGYIQGHVLEFYDFADDSRTRYMF